jgi:WD40 repeat protein
MDRPELIAVAIALAVGCGGGAPRAGTGAVLDRPGATAATGLLRIQVAARGVLTYDVALVGDELVSIELRERFELVIREPGGPVRLRVDLGPAEYDVGDLAVANGTAWVASADGTARSIDLRNGAVTRVWHLGARGTAIAVTGDGAYVATGTSTGVLCLRRVADQALLQCVVAHQAAISGLDFAPGGATLASSGWDGAVVAWSVPALAMRARTRVAGSANQVAIAPDGHTVAIATSPAPPVRTPELADRERRGQLAHAPSQIVLWRPARGARACSGHGAPVVGIAWAGAARLLTSSWDRTVRLWDYRSCASLAVLGGFGGLVRRVAVGPGDSRVAVAAWPGDLDSPSTVVLGLLYPSTAPAD